MLCCVVLSECELGCVRVMVRMCVCYGQDVCVRARARACVCVCVCVRERERERGGGREDRRWRECDRRQGGLLMRILFNPDIKRTI